MRKSQECRWRVSIQKTDGTGFKAKPVLFHCWQGVWLTLVKIPENAFGRHERILKELGKVRKSTKETTWRREWKLER
jgi:hypothetical protein